MRGGGQYPAGTWWVGVVVALLVCGALPGRAAAAPVGGIREQARAVAAFGRSLAFPEADPPGANDWRCALSAQRPRPVVLVHGTWMNAASNWEALSPALRRAGYCVFALNYGGAWGHPVKGRAPVPDSAVELEAFVERVLAATGGERVDLVGFSQGGGALPRWYLKHGPGKDRVAHLVGIAPSNHGTSMSGLARLADNLGAMGLVERVAGRAAADQAAGSWLHRALDDGGDTVEGIAYTTIVSRTDLVLTPYRSQFLTGPRVINHIVQDYCPFVFTGHLGMPYDPIVRHLVLTALDPGSPPADGPPPCDTT
ncbi:alpha/beta fold hydrolase [Streptomyces sp. NPDC051577]|uniref:esterase/lipase family protein n=1 Tax=Streptomyces sp. NPDC051577 TaxID=3155166 RepID=UPI00341BC44D